MALAKFVKIRMMGWASLRDDVLKELQETGAVEIIKVTEKDVSADEQTGREPDLQTGQVEFCLKSFSPFQKKGILESLLPGKISVGIDEYRETVENFSPVEPYGKCKKTDEKLRELTGEKEKLRVKYQELLPWVKLDVTPGDLKGTENAEILLATVPRRHFENLSRELEETCFIKKIDESGTAAFYIFVCLREDRESVDAVLKNSDSQVVRLPESEESESGLMLREICENAAKRIKQVEKLSEDLMKEIETASINTRKLLIFHDYLSNIQSRNDVIGKLGFTQSVFVLEGWARQRNLRGIAGRISRKFPEVHIEERMPEEGEVPPVELENKKSVQPFEAVTKLYGLPASGEMDPTPLFAPFFTVFFAMCLTDAGYGLLMVLLTWFCLKKLNLTGTGRRMVKMLSIAGAMTIVVGLLTGGMLGFQFENVPQKLMFLKTFRNSVMLFDPMKQFLIFLLLSLGLGFIQVWFGFFVKLVQEFKNGNYRDGILKQVPWLAILPGLVILGIVRKPDIILLGFVKESPLGGCWEQAALVMIILGVCGMFIQPGGGNIFKRIGSGIYSLYGIIGCFGDILSYIRLFALGLATLAMAIAVNTMAGMMMQIPKVGIIIAIPVFVVGHVANMVINSFSGFIHTVRLQFVEFFTKFYEGGGRSFCPLAVENEHIEIAASEFVK